MRSALPTEVPPNFMTLTVGDHRLADMDLHPTLARDTVEIARLPLDDETPNIPV